MQQTAGEASSDGTHAARPLGGVRAARAVAHHSTRRPAAAATDHLGHCDRLDVDAAEACGQLQLLVPPGNAIVVLMLLLNHTTYCLIKKRCTATNICAMEIDVFRSVFEELQRLEELIAVYY